MMAKNQSSSSIVVVVKDPNKKVAPLLKNPNHTMTLSSSTTTNTNTDSKKKKKNINTRMTSDWKQYVPIGTVDPISLESIRALRYPPFVLKVSSPFIIPLDGDWWTIPLSLQEQEVSTSTTTTSMSQLYHFFDGKVLAYYMVSPL